MRDDEQFLRDFQRTIDHITYRFSPADAAKRLDLAQECRLALLRARELFDPTRGVKFTTYAYHAMTHACMVYLSQSKREITFAEANITGEEEEEDEAASPENTALDHEEARQQLAAVWDIFTPDEQQILLLKYRDEVHSRDELARLTKWGKNRVRRTVESILRKVRQLRAKSG